MSQDRVAAKLALRYGTAPVSRGRRIGFWVIAIVVAAAGTYWVNSINTPKASGRIISFGTHPDHMSVTFETTRPGGHGSTCVLRAQDLNGYDVGYAAVYVGAGAATRTVAYELRTTSVANLVDVLGCGVDASLPHVAAPAFAPGIKPPAEPWTP